MDGIHKKYRAISVKDWWEESEGKPVPDDFNDSGWVVLEGKIPRFTRRMSEMEAKVIAFALNAAHNGHSLAEIVDPNNPSADNVFDRGTLKINEGIPY